jgi:hypothetical protein
MWRKRRTVIVIVVGKTVFVEKSEHEHETPKGRFEVTRTREALA